MAMVSLQYLASILILALYILAVITCAVILKRQGIRAMVFGKTHKSDFILMPFILFLFYVLLANTFSWPIFDVLIARFWASNALGWIGIVVSAGGLIFFIYSLVSFGTSFRVGIDKKDPAKLITTKAFAISRNPLYVCFFALFGGLFLVHCNVVVAITLVVFVLVIHRQVLREEAFLREHYGAEFEDYCKKVRRYL